MNQTHQPKALVVGGGIGGLAAALALANQGVRIELLEQAETIGEIGAGIQLAANAFAALDALGVGEAARGRSVFTDHITLRDAIDRSVIAQVDVGAPYREPLPPDRKPLYIQNNQPTGFNLGCDCMRGDERNTQFSHDCLFDCFVATNLNAELGPLRRCLAGKLFEDVACARAAFTHEERLPHEILARQIFTAG